MRRIFFEITTSLNKFAPRNDKQKKFCGNLIPCHPEKTFSPELVSGSLSGSCSKIADQARNDKKIKGFTLIELLVVVLIIAILAAIALPKYMVTRDRARLTGLMTIGKNVNDALDRRSLFDSGYTNGALNLLDITFQKFDGTGDCTGGTCDIKVSGKKYTIRPYLNNGGLGKNIALFYSISDPLFGLFWVYTEQSSSNDYRLNCYDGGWTTMTVSVEAARCERVAESLGASCSGSSGAKSCYW